MNVLRHLKPSIFSNHHLLMQLSAKGQVHILYMSINLPQTVTIIMMRLNTHEVICLAEHLLLSASLGLMLP